MVIEMMNHLSSCRWNMPRGEKGKCQAHTRDHNIRILLAIMSLDARNREISGLSREVCNERSH